jgi:hypothetical protein
MPKNKVVAKNNRPGSNKATGRDYSYDKKYQSTEDRKKYRVELNKANRKDGTYGNGDGMDKSHTKSGKLVNESQSKNRARNRGKK